MVRRISRLASSLRECKESVARLGERAFQLLGSFLERGGGRWGEPS
jgi:hypothetical protein